MKTPLSFKKYQPVGLRIWHWLNALAISGSLLTVALHKTFLNPRKNAVLIQEKMTEAGTPVSLDLAKQAARVLRERMFDWHYYFGFLLAAVFLIRILVALIHKEFPWRPAVAGLKHFRIAPSGKKRAAFHFALVKAGYLSFYAIVLVMIVTGLSMYFSDALKLTRHQDHNLHAIHEFFLWYFIIFIAAHILGVVVGEFGSARGLISNMIHGGEKD